MVFQFIFCFKFRINVLLLIIIIEVTIKHQDSVMRSMPAGHSFGASMKLLYRPDVSVKHRMDDWFVLTFNFFLCCKSGQCCLNLFCDIVSHDSWYEDIELYIHVPISFSNGAEVRVMPNQGHDYQYLAFRSSTDNITSISKREPTGLRASILATLLARTSKIGVTTTRRIQGNRMPQYWEQCSEMHL